MDHNTDLVLALSEAVVMVNDVVPIRYHEDVRRMYNWSSVAERTEKVRLFCARMRVQAVRVSLMLDAP